MSRDHNLIWDFFNVIMTAQEIKQDEERREKSVRFGVVAIIFSVIAVVFAAGAALLLSLLTGGNEAAVLLFIFVIAGIAVCGGSALVLLVGALLRVIAQLSINRKAIGWVALAIFLASLIAAVVLFIVLL